ncbi:MAG: hypothetical protein ACI9JM_000103 [Halioglobus sp.]|jgi:hypothetical protein
MDNAAMSDAPMNEQVSELEQDTEQGAEQGREEAAQNDTQATSSKDGGGMQLAKIAGTHVGVLLLTMSMFAAADSWAVLTGLGLASLLAVATAFVAGITIATLIHEWFHYLGARRSGGAYIIPRKLSLFVFDWNFEANNVSQFFTMSIAGSIGGAVAVLLLWNGVPADTLGRATLRAAAVGAFVFAAIIEWPVIQRTRTSQQPMEELAKIDQQVLTRAFVGGMAAIVVLTMMLHE